MAPGPLRPQVRIANTAAADHTLVVIIIALRKIGITDALAGRGPERQPARRPGSVHLWNQDGSIVPVPVVPKAFIQMEAEGQPVCGHNIRRRMRQVMITTIIRSDPLFDELNTRREGCTLSRRHDPIHLRYQLTGPVLVRDHRRTKTIYILQHLEGGIRMQGETLQSTRNLQLLPKSFHFLPRRIARKSGIKVLGVEIPEIRRRAERHAPAIIELMTKGHRYRPVIEKAPGAP